MNTTVRKFAVGLASAALVASAAAPAFAAVSDGNRIAGETRYDTAIAEAGKFVGGTGDVTVVLANGEDSHLVDAITGGKLKGGPMLYVNNEDKDVQAKVKEALGKFSGHLVKVYVLGGTDTVSDDTVKAVVPTQLLKDGELDSTKVIRLGGETRYDTAAAIAKVVKAQDSGTGQQNDVVYLANGVTKVDALVAGQIADDAQILLTDGSGTLPKATVDYLAATHPSKVIALGGTVAVSQAELAAAQAATTVTSDNKDDAVTAAAKALADANQAVNGYVTVDQKATTDASTVDKYLALAAGGTIIETPSINGSTITSDDSKALIKATFPKVAPNLVMSGNTDAVFFNKFGTADLAVGGLTTPNAPAEVWDPTEKDDATGKTVTMFGGATAVDTHYNHASNGVYAKAAKQWGKSDGSAKDNLTVTDNIDTLLGTPGNDGSALKISTAYSGNISSTGAATEKALWAGIKDIYPVEAPLSVKVGDNTYKLDSSTADATLALVKGTDLLKALYPSIVLDSSDQISASERTVAQTNIKATLKAQVEALKAKADAAKKDLEDKTKALADAYTAYNAAVALNTGTSATTSRIEGADRYETALNIAKNAYAGTPTTAKKIYLANGYSLADSAVSGYLDNNDSVGSYPGIAGPVLLVETNKLGDNAAKFISTLYAGNTRLLESDIVAVGGKSVVDDSVIEAGQKALTK